MAATHLKMQQILLARLELGHLGEQPPLLRPLLVRELIRVAHELVEVHALRILEDRALGLPADRRVVRRRRRVAEQEERDDLCSLEDDVALRDRFQLGVLWRSEFRSERRHEVVALRCGSDRHSHETQVVVVRVVRLSVVVAVLECHQPDSEETRQRSIICGFMEICIPAW